MNHNFRLSVVIILAIFVLFTSSLACAAPQTPSEYRDWSSANGKFSVEAKLISSDDKTVKLRTRKGKVIDVEIAKLSRADRSHLDKKQRSRTRKKDDSAPTSVAKFIAKRDKSFIGNISVNAGVSFRKKSPPLKVLKFRGKFGSAEKLNFPLQRIESTMPPDDSVNAENSWISSWAISYNERHLAAVISSSSTRKVWAVVYNLADGTASEPLLLPWDDTRIRSVSPDGKTLLTSCSRFTRKDLWVIGEGKLEHSKGWSQKGNAKSGSSGFGSALMIDDHKILSGSSPVQWDLRSGFDDWVRKGKAVYRSGHISLSADRSHFAVADEKRLHIFSIFGRHEGTLADEEIESDFSQAAFSPSGKFLAAKTGDQLVIWELEKGRVVDRFPITKSGCLSWVDDQHIFSGGSLYDVRLHAAVWNYEVDVKNLVPLSDGRFVLVGVSGARVFEFPAVDPDGSRFGSLERDKLRVIRAGQRISLDMADLEANDVPQQDNVRKLWEARLTTYGMNVQPGSRGNRVVRFEIGKAKSRSGVVWFESRPNGLGSFSPGNFSVYRKPTETEKRRSNVFGFGAGLHDSSTKKIRYRPSYGRISLIVDGEVEWEAYQVFSPPRVTLTLEPDGSLKDLIEEACFPRPLFFATNFVPIDLCTIPSDLVGESKIDLDGVN